MNPFTNLPPEAIAITMDNDGQWYWWTVDPIPAPYNDKKFWCLPVDAAFTGRFFLINPQPEPVADWRQSKQLRSDYAAA